MKIQEDKKIDVLMNALDERYKSIHTIRERVQTVSIWILGILIGASGWLFQSDTCFSINDKFFSVVFLLIIWATLRWFYFNDLQKGFNSQMRVAAKIEDSLGLFEGKIYSDSEDSIYPKSWKKSGQNGCEGKFFDNSHNLLIVGFGILCFVILLLK